VEQTRRSALRQILMSSTALPLIMQTQTYRQATWDAGRQAMLLQLAENEMGEAEIPGPENNERILEYIRTLNSGPVSESELTAWCSGFVAFVAINAGCDIRGATLMARSWLFVGDPIDLPTPGDVVILWRESKSSGKGHVGFFVKQDENRVLLISGNSGNAVTYNWFSRKRMLGVRRLKAA
jgi:uncharacterized protein (TIGR02594 family)